MHSFFLTAETVETVDQHLYVSIEFNKNYYVYEIQHHTRIDLQITLFTSSIYKKISPVFWALVQIFQFQD